MTVPSTVWRSFVTLSLVASGSCALISGLILFIVPEGSLARWLLWNILGFGKGQWEAAHTLGSLLFVVFAVLHLFNNRRTLFRYLAITGEGHARKPQIFAALALTLLFFFSAVYSLPPLIWVMDFGSWAKESWVSHEHVPPFDHAEDLPLTKFCERMFIDPGAAQSALRQEGFAVTDSRDSLALIARANGCTPVDLYRVLQPLERPLGRTPVQE